MTDTQTQTDAHNPAAKNLLIASLVWLASTVLSVFFETEFTASLWILSVLWWLALYATGVFLICYSLLLILIKKTPSKRRRVLALSLGIPAATFAFLFFVGTGWVFGARFQLIGIGGANRRRAKPDRNLLKAGI